MPTQTARLRRTSLLSTEVLDRSRVLDTLVNNLEGMAYRCLNDADWRMIFVSQGCLELTGYNPAELVDNSHISWEEITCLQDRAAVRECVSAAVNCGKRFTVSYRITTQAGQEKWVMERGIAVLDEHGETVIEGFIEDVTAQRTTLEVLEQTELRYRSIFEHACEGIFQTSNTGQYLAANPALAKIYGYATPQELMTKLVDIGRHLYVDASRREAFQRLMQNHGEVFNFESEVYRQDGARIWISENAHSVRDPQGELICYEGTVQDISERKRHQEQLERQANHDLLTGLPNRTLLGDRIEQGIAHAARMGYVGWVEFVLAVAATTHIAYLYEDGSIYFPEGPQVVSEWDLREAEAAGRLWPLVRVEWDPDA